MKITAPYRGSAIEWLMVLIALVIAGAIFAIDVNTAVGLAIGGMYCIVIVYSWLLPKVWAPVYVGLFCVALILLGWFYSPSSDGMAMYGGLNRIISIVVVSVAVALVTLAKQSIASLDSVRKQLEIDVESGAVSLSAAQRKFESFFENAPDALVIADATGKIELVNAQFCSLFGYERSEVLGQSIEMLLPERFRGNHAGFREGFMANPTLRPMGNGVDLFARLKSGAEVPVEISLSPIETQGGVVISAALRDVTARRAIEQQLKDQNEELHSKTQELEQFAYVASHDLQEPLRAVTSYLQLLQRYLGGQLDEKGQKYVDVAIDGAKRMKQLIQELLAYSRIDSRDRKIEQVDCSELVGLIREDLVAANQGRAVEIEITALPKLKAEEIQLRLLFQNLISNGLKFCKEDSVPRVEVAARELDEQWEFIVRDNGIGIPEEYKESVFVIFNRLHTRAEYPGTGMGLAICKKIVERHGGQIWLESEPGQWTAVHFTIPK